MKKVLRTAFSVADHDIKCKHCSKSIQVVWTKAMGFMMMPVILIMATLFRDIENHLVRDFFIAFFIYVPLGIVLGVCLVPLKTIINDDA
jgi:hypothetical protein